MPQTLRKRITIYAGSALTFYTLLVAALTYFESMSSAANITSFPKALWYSIVVITTRMYGELFPITVYGRWIGMVFLLLGVVFYCFLIAAGISGLIHLRRRWKPEKS
ncbi:potassium channel family protein [Imperialibacter roseus]|uniref:Potassium channel family protein n=1 Tax=Imperialibacter roseus TaxID=1324217 RepID=A0ABZ0IWB5_9BACT|nr:potassium channel family protein [Imperialibacter roseus]WOK08802.1 potassium channel family protein [Imperialibacter roseus]